jgi:cytochrome oxidase Cu insertion factor (SCO1/SenC/PrrC family)
MENNVMRQLGIAAIIFLIASLASAAGSPRTSPVGVGDVAPDFTLQDQNGHPVALSASRGQRPVVLVFYRGYW